MYNSMHTIAFTSIRRSYSHMFNFQCSTQEKNCQHVNNFVKLINTQCLKSRLLFKQLLAVRSLRVRKNDIKKRLNEWCGIKLRLFGVKMEKLVVKLHQTTDQSCKRNCDKKHNRNWYSKLWVVFVLQLQTDCSCNRNCDKQYNRNWYS
jgi:hypothetical protein